MPCYHPLTAWRAPPLQVTRAGDIVFNDPHDTRYKQIQLACGQCIGCRLERSRQWALRCVHEASLYEDNCFLTLTYDDDHLPPDLSLNTEDIQLFMKRLRRRIEPKKVRFFQCGEYGEQFGRPHHHVILFGYDFPDKELVSRNFNGNNVYRSNLLCDLWDKGFSSIGAVSFESAAYVARYILKKVTGDSAEDHYSGRKPEFITMSRRPGIASDWFDKYYTDVYPKDFVTIKDGVKCHPPKYYDKLFERNHYEDLKTIKQKRQAVFDDPRYQSELLRLHAKEQHKLLSIKSLKRNID